MAFTLSSLLQPYLVRGSIQIKWDGPALGRRPRATWRFVDTATSAAEGDARWGSMVVLPSLRLLAPYVRAVLTDIRTQGNVGQGNVLHLVLLAAKESLSTSLDRWVAGRVTRVEYRCARMIAANFDQ